MGRMFKPGTMVYHSGFGRGTVVRPYLPDKLLLDFEKHAQKLLVAHSPCLTAEFPTIHIEGAGADKTWMIRCPKWVSY